MIKKLIIDKISNLLMKIMNKQTRYAIIQERVNDIIEDLYKLIIERLRTDIKTGKIKLK